MVILRQGAGLSLMAKKIQISGISDFIQDDIGEFTKRFSVNLAKKVNKKCPVDTGSLAESFTFSDGSSFGNYYRNVGGPVDPAKVRLNQEKAIDRQAERTAPGYFYMYTTDAPYANYVYLADHVNNGDLRFMKLVSPDIEAALLDSIR